MEITYLSIAVITLSFAFVQFFGMSRPGLMVGVVLGITLHELGHKFVAQSMGFHSEFKLWPMGLLLVVGLGIISVMSGGGFIFAAPGYVVTHGMATIRQRGIVTLAAPFTNLLLGLFFLALPVPWGKDAAMVNVFLAIFNLIPIRPLDGAAIIRWSQSAWGVTFLSSLLLGVFVL